MYKILYKEIEYSEYVIRENEITLSDRHTQAILNFPQPKSVCEVQQFLGLTNYFCKFIKNYTLKARPLQCLFRKSVNFCFDENCLNSFNIEKKARHIQFLHFYNPIAITELYTDASSLRLGAILFQEQSNGH